MAPAVTIADSLTRPLSSNIAHMTRSAISVWVGVGANSGVAEDDVAVGDTAVGAPGVGAD